MANFSEFYSPTISWRSAIVLINSSQSDRYVWPGMTHPAAAQ